MSPLALRLRETRTESGRGVPERGVELDGVVCHALELAFPQMSPDEVVGTLQQLGLRRLANRLAKSEKEKSSAALEASGEEVAPINLGHLLAVGENDKRLLCVSRVGRRVGPALAEQIREGTILFEESIIASIIPALVGEERS